MTKMHENPEKAELKNLYRQMYLIRKFEETAAEMYLRGKISGFTHLASGEEAIAVGVMSALFDKDYVVSAYRDHGHALAKGATSRAVMAELFGKETGMCHGLGGSMHLFDQNLRFMGGYAIVGGGIPIATGLGLAIKYKDEDIICACFFGDGAVNEGAFHESLNLARIWNLPVLFICENNLYAMGTDIIRASAVTDVYKRAEAYNMPGESANGMDVLEVKEVTARAARKVRKGDGPYLLEFKTYRYRAHSMADLGRYRTIEEEEIWRERDPIQTFAKYFVEIGIFEPDELKEIQESVEVEVLDAVEFAEKSPNPNIDLLTEFIYIE